MKIGVSSYSFSQYIRQGKMTQFDTVAKAKELGFDNIEFTELAPPEGVTQIEFAKQLKAEAERVGIEISAHVVGGNLARANEEDLMNEVERLKGCVDVAFALGAKFFRHDVMYRYDEFRSYNDALPSIAKGARMITEYAETLGIKTMTENHGTIFQDPDRMEQLIYAVNHKNYGLLLDMGNFLCADVQPDIAISRVGNLAFMVHGKDFKVHNFYERTTEGYTTRAQNKLVGVSVGEGDAKTEQAIAILKNYGFDGYIDVEYEGTDDCIEGMKKGLEFLRKII
ncbi:MAG: sugar phosphate isomerase/epimerase [Clostridia bacterium]|nr:sugar phosphate isomerase/epimerase [Clostridia bacterium]